MSPRPPLRTQASPTLTAMPRLVRQHFHQIQLLPGRRFSSIAALRFWRMAVAANSPYIVTYNLADFRGTERWGVAAVRPSDFLQLIEKEK